MGTSEAIARPRVGLLGNPSDIYRGRVLGFTFCDFGAQARVEPAERTELVGPGGERLEVGSPCSLDPRSLRGASRLLAAALRRLAAFAPHQVEPAARPFRLTATTTIPRQVGLAGSSALVVAALRALSAWFAVALDAFELSELALLAETLELGSVAGPQDRVLQAWGGLLFMDFREPRDPARYVRLDPALLPPLFLAWDPSPGEDSHSVHSHVHARWAAGDPAVRAALAVFPRLADEGVRRLRQGDAAGLADLLDAAFEARSALFAIGAGDRERVAIARAHGAGASLCGSGGAIVGVPRDPRSLAALSATFEGARQRFLVPRVEVASA